MPSKFDAGALSKRLHNLYWIFSFGHNTSMNEESPEVVTGTLEER